MSQATFKRAIEFTLPWECGRDKSGGLRADGGLNMADGSVTKYGIRQKAHPNVDVPNLTLEKALEIYHEEYWDWYKTKTPVLDLDNVPTDYACVVFDSGVNCGTNRCYSWHLKSLNEKDPAKVLLGFRDKFYFDLKSAGNKIAIQSYKGWMARLSDLKKLVDVIRAEDATSSVTKVAGETKLAPFASR